MSWKDTKITFFNYFPYDCAAVEEYLERMERLKFFVLKMIRKLDLSILMQRRNSKKSLNHQYIMCFVNFYQCLY
ncbi:hypothetical protein [Inconstantimicrobium mannanitabidum]|uniref:hypothetical protein n=1 Tax=Inconstantimicrobium mannanitabidum TaxID=1604901 RepID=UPI0021C27EF8|nr:hypothetical protein [Clostridium sp. TW13]